MDCGLKEIKMKYDQWSVDSRKWDGTWTMKCGLKEIRWNMNNEVDKCNNWNMEDITYADYVYAKRVCEEFKIKN